MAIVYDFLAFKEAIKDIKEEEKEKAIVTEKEKYIDDDDDNEFVNIDSLLFSHTFDGEPQPLHSAYILIQAAGFYLDSRDIGHLCDAVELLNQEVLSLKQRFGDTWVDNSGSL